MFLYIKSILKDERDPEPVVWILQKLHLPIVSNLGCASSLRALLNNIHFQEERDLDPGARILQNLRPPVVSSLGQASSLRALVNNINFIGGAGSGARGIELTKAPPLCGIESGAGILSLIIIFISGGAGSGARGMDPTKAPPPCGIKFGAGILLPCSCK